MTDLATAPLTHCLDLADALAESLELRQSPAASPMREVARILRYQVMGARFTPAPALHAWDLYRLVAELADQYEFLTTSFPFALRDRARELRERVEGGA